jgi:hypothetical protein
LMPRLSIWARLSGCLVSALLPRVSSATCEPTMTMLSVTCYFYYCILELASCTQMKRFILLCSYIHAWMEDESLELCGLEKILTSESREGRTDGVCKMQNSGAELRMTNFRTRDWRILRKLWRVCLTHRILESIMSDPWGLHVPPMTTTINGEPWVM